HFAAPIQAFRSQLALTGFRTRLPGNITDRVDHVGVGDRASCHCPSWVFPGPVGSRGDPTALLAQDPTDRLDRMPLSPHGVDKTHDHRLRGSSSPAKKLVAARKIATSSRRREFSVFRRLISACSSLLTPSRSPASISACSTHRRRLSWPTPV